MNGYRKVHPRKWSKVLSVLAIALCFGTAYAEVIIWSEYNCGGQCFLFRSDGW